MDGRNKDKKELGLVLKLATSSSKRSNNHQSIDQTMENSEIQIYYSNKNSEIGSSSFILI
jgi:hypothetical protein